jgi:hypothetical protein
MRCSAARLDERARLARRLKARWHRPRWHRPRRRRPRWLEEDEGQNCHPAASSEEIVWLAISRLVISPRTISRPAISRLAIWSAASPPQESASLEIISSLEITSSEVASRELISPDIACWELRTRESPSTASRRASMDDFYPVTIQRQNRRIKITRVRARIDQCRGPPDARELSRETLTGFGSSVICDNAITA